MAYIDPQVRREIFAGQAGIQFVTLFSFVIAIILFGIIDILEGKELAALLGGLSGYILGFPRMFNTNGWDWEEREGRNGAGAACCAGGTCCPGGSSRPSYTRFIQVSLNTSWTNMRTRWDTRDATFTLVLGESSRVTGKQEVTDYFLLADIARRHFAKRFERGKLNFTGDVLQVISVVGRQ
jgi:hypothetical protein